VPKELPKGFDLSTMMKLKQNCNHPAQFLQDNAGLKDRSGKLATSDGDGDEFARLR